MFLLFFLILVEKFATLLLVVKRVNFGIIPWMKIAVDPKKILRRGIALRFAVGAVCCGVNFFQP